MKSRIAITSLLWTLMFGCGVPSQLTGKNDDAGSSSSGGEAEVVSESDDKVVAKIDSSKDQTISLSDKGALKGTSVTIPAGSLAAGTEVTVEEGTPLASAGQAEDLGLGTNTTVSQASAPVFIGSNKKSDPVNPFAISISTDGASLLATKNLVIFYRIIKYAENKSYVGVLPASKYEKDGSKITFDAAFFGIYQAVYVDVEVSEVVEKSSNVTPTGASEVAKGFETVQGTWLTDCKINDGEVIIEGTENSKWFEFNLESLVPSSTGNYNVGDGDFERVDLENDWIGKNIKATSGYVDVTSLDPFQGTYHLYDFSDGDDSYSGTISGTFDVPSDGSSGSFTAVGTGDLISVQISTTNATYDTNRGNERIRYDFSGNTLLLHHEFHTDADCTQLFESRRIYMTLEKKGDGTWPGEHSGDDLDGSKIESTVTKLAVLNSDSDQADLYKSHCGTSGNEINVEYEISDPEECGYPAIGEKIFNIAHMKSDDELIMGHIIGGKEGYPEDFMDFFPLKRK